MASNIDEFVANSEVIEAVQALAEFLLARMPVSIHFTMYVEPVREKPRSRHKVDWSKYGF